VARQHNDNRKDVAVDNLKKEVRAGRMSDLNWASPCLVAVQSWLLKTSIPSSGVNESLKTKAGMSEYTK